MHVDSLNKILFGIFIISCAENIMSLLKSGDMKVPLVARNFIMKAYSHLSLCFMAIIPMHL